MTNLLAALLRSGGSSGGGLALGLGAARVVAAVLILILLFLLGTATKHGEDRRSSHRLVIGSSGLRSRSL